jgi:rSAM/selenodomain-associated transferase 2
MSAHRAAAHDLSIIMPARNEAGGIVATLQALQDLRARGAEVIVVDGASDDDTAARAAPWADRVVRAEPGRALQMNVGAQHSRRPVLLFLHADTRLPADADRLLLAALARGGREWGRFDVRIVPETPLLWLVAAMMNLRSRITGICTGDQALFVTRAAFHAVGAYPAQALMEDIALSRRLKRLGPPLALRAQVQTSGRRWMARGVWRTIVLMWWLRLRYFFGASPTRLARIYQDDTASRSVHLAPRRAGRGANPGGDQET